MADYKGDGRIDYSEFLAATIISKCHLEEEILWNTFSYFDRDGTGEITVENLYDALVKSGK